MHSGKSRRAGGNSRINRYIMECKFGRGRIQTNLWRELIDTLWNVNVDAAGVLSEYDKELIDTLWNVNI